MGVWNLCFNGDDVTTELRGDVGTGVGMPIFSGEADAELVMSSSFLNVPESRTSLSSDDCGCCCCCCCCWGNGCCCVCGFCCDCVPDSSSGYGIGRDLDCDRSCRETFPATNEPFGGDGGNLKDCGLPDGT